MINLDIKIRHRNWEEALSMLFALLVSASPGEVICITGPARTGKTRMIEELRYLLHGGPDGDKNSAYMPTAYVLVDNDGNNGRFTTKSFIWDALVSIQHPDFYGLTDSENITRKFDRSSEVAMKKAFIIGARYRKLKYLFFDEVQHVNYVTGADAPHMVLDSWKNMAKQADVVLVLAGAYPMLDTLRNSPHLIGRQYKVNLPRYYETEPDLNEFASIISQYMQHLPEVLIGENLIGHTRYLHRYSYGCIGILRRWLLHAAIYAQRHRTKINRDTLEATRATDDDLRSIGNEIAAGEKILFRGTEFSSEVKTSSKTPELPEKMGKAVKQKQRTPFKAKPRRYSPGGREGDI